MLPRIYRSDTDIRKHQINTLKIFNLNVAEVLENQEYQVKFTSGSSEYTLTVNLGKDLSKEKPTITICPPIAHPWVNSEGEVTGAPGLINFTIHSDLGRVVQAIIREFERNPPPIKDLRSTVTSPVNNERNSPQTYLQVFPTQQQQRSNIFPELNKLNLEELEFLNNNIDRQQEFINEIPTIKEQNRLIDDVIGQIEELAEDNLSKEDILPELKNGIDQRIEDVTKLAFEIERLYVAYQNLSDKYSPFKIKEKLKIAAEEAEQDCETIADRFLKGEIDVDNFISMYTKVRSLSQSRKTKEEKLSQQLQNLERAGF